MILELFILLPILWIIYDYYQHKGLVKGPFRFPVLGNIPQILLANPKYIHQAFLKIGKNYKDLVLIKLGSKEIVVINSYSVVKELLRKEDLIARRILKPVVALYPDKTKGLTATNGKDGFDQRKHFHSFLAEFGFGNQKMHIKMAQTEAEEYVKFCEKIAVENKGKVNMFGNLHISTFNILFKMISGSGRKYDDVEFFDFLKTFKRMAKDIAVLGSIGEIFPFTKPFFDGDKLSSTHGQNVQKCVKKILASAYKNYKSNPDINCAFNILNEKEIFNEKFLCLLVDIFLGGFDTTPDSLLWAFAYLANNPDVQEKLEIEIENAFTEGNKCLYEAKSRLNYLQAIILEALRISPFVPFTIPRIAMKDIKYNDILIPKGTEIISNIYGINNDPNIWENPEKFDPTRFIDPSTGEVILNAAILNFGAGKRYCLGKSFALDIMYTFFLTILKNFKITSIPNDPPSLQPQLGATIQPNSFDLIFEKRI